MVLLFLMRHGKSCSNHVRQTYDTDAGHRVSQSLRDPGLSEQGVAHARSYGPVLRQRLADAGVPVATLVVGSSGLRRARDTARIVFDRPPTLEFPMFKEFGNVAENTPVGQRHSSPNWRAFLRAVEDTGESSVAVVGHGSFLTSVVRKLEHRHVPAFKNLDGVLLEVVDGTVRRVRLFRAPPMGAHTHAADRCSVASQEAFIQKKLGTQNRTMRQRRQQGGGVTMPLAWFQNGAQMSGTSAWPTGPTGQSSDPAVIRPTLRGGFHPSVMGAFVSNGMRLLPVAGYMGYSMNKRRRTRKGRRSHRRSTRRV